MNHQYTDYTHPDVLTLGVAQGWAEAETDPARIDWTERQARAAIPFQVTGGRPVNPCQTTAVRHGRNEMGLWGETLNADALVTVILPRWVVRYLPGRLTRCLPRRLTRYLRRWGTRHLLLVERGDGYGWAAPGGRVERGETALQAALRELAEETGLDAMSVTGTVMVVQPARYVPDPRASDEAWAVTWPVGIDLVLGPLPAVTGGDDAARARWVPAATYDSLRATLAARYGGTVFAAHAAMLAEFLSTAGEATGQ